MPKRRMSLERYLNLLLAPPKPPKPVKHHPKRFQTTDEFRQMKCRSSEHTEKNDCTVIACSLVSGIPYAKMHELLEAAGRKRGHGLHTANYIRVVREQGFNAEKIDPRYFISKYPGKNVERTHVTSKHMGIFPEVFRDGHSYIFVARGHCWAVIDGKSHDWSVNRSLRVQAIYRIRNTK